MTHLPIGLFDSGLGGLTVLRALMRRLPSESFIYLADTARFPYGPRPPSDIQRYAIENARFLLDQGIKMLVVPCHTASIHALHLLQQECPVPVIGMLDASLKAFQTSQAVQRVVILGTASTISSELYQNQLHQAYPHLEFISLACPELVLLAEQYGQFPTHAEEIIRNTLQGLSFDALFFGCTHFPLLRSLIQSVVPPSVRLIDPAEACAKEVERQLIESNQLNSLTSPVVRLHTTCNRTTFLSIARKIIAQKQGL